MNVRSHIPLLLWMLALALLLPACLVAPAAAQEGPLREVPPNGITVDELIRRFATKEKQFKLAREQYTWTQSVKIQTLQNGRVDGEYQMVFDVLFDDSGRRIQQVTFAPQSTLTRINVTQEDLDDVEQRMPFTMTIDDLPSYQVTYIGQQRVDELDCYVFRLAPKKIEKHQRYFEGKIWVDDRDFQIVKTYGKNVPDVIHKKGAENLFPRFTTWRQQIDGKYWFPTYTSVNDTLHFSMGDVDIRQVVKYEDYRRFEAQTKILYEGKEVEGAGGKPASPGKDTAK